MNYKVAGFIIVIFAILISLFFVLPQNKENTTKVKESSEEPAKVLGASTQDAIQEKIIKKISVSEAKEFINTNKDNDNFKIIDIRTFAEYTAGNIEKSANIDFFGNFEEEISKLDKDDKYLIYCQSGSRSAQAINLFREFDFNEVYELEGGYKAWATQ